MTPRTVPTDANAATRGGDIGCVEAERAVLGALLLGFADTPGLASRLRVDDFVDPRHRDVLDAVLDLTAAGVPTDSVTVLAHLRRTGRLDSFTADRTSGVFLADLAAACPAPSMADYYARAVIEHAVRRRALQAGQRIAQAAGSSALADLLVMVRSESSAVRLCAGRLDPLDETVTG